VNRLAVEQSVLGRGQLLRVVLWMTGALLSFSAMAVSVRVLADTLSVVEILAVRSGLGLWVMASLTIMRRELRATIVTRQLPLHVLRNTIHLGAQYLWAMSLLLLPLATVFALEFTAPAWTLILALPLLGERMTASRIGAVGLGLLGVLVILRPGLATFQPAALVVLGAAFGFATTLVLTKKLTRTDSTFAIIFWMNLIQFPLALAGSDLLFVSKLLVLQIPAVIAVGISGLASHYCLANAFRAGDATVVVPLDFIRIPLIAVIGWWLYAEPLDVFVFLGAGLIIAGILWNLQSEARRTTAMPMPAPAETAPEQAPRKAP
jgi:drug/metabolite transporter (DMT)-like permease